MNSQEATVILTGRKVGRWVVGELVDGPNCNQCGEPVKMELKVLVAVCISLAGAKVLLEQGRVTDAQEIISAAYGQLNAFLSDMADQTER